MNLQLGHNLQDLFAKVSNQQMNIDIHHVGLPQDGSYEYCAKEAEAVVSLSPPPPSGFIDCLLLFLDVTRLFDFRMYSRYQLDSISNSMYHSFELQSIGNRQSLTSACV